MDASLRLNRMLPCERGFIVGLQCQVLLWTVSRLINCERERDTCRQNSMYQLFSSRMYLELIATSGEMWSRGNRATCTWMWVCVLGACDGGSWNFSHGSNARFRNEPNMILRAGDCGHRHSLAAGGDKITSNIFSCLLFCWFHYIACNFIHVLWSSIHSLKLVCTLHVPLLSTYVPVRPFISSSLHLHTI